MDSAELPRLFYLVLLGTALVGWFIAENRQSLGKTMRQLLVWGLIFLGAIGGYGLWSDIRDDVAPRQSVIADGTRIEVPRGTDGHFHLTLQLNGTPVSFVVDTGATDIVLSDGDARRIGIDPDDLIYSGVANTANGVVRTARTTLDQVALGPVTFRNVKVSVNGGEMDGSLLGMAYLNRFERIEIADGKLALVP